jgi:hypothetical protein
MGWGAAVRRDLPENAASTKGAAILAIVMSRSQCKSSLPESSHLQ